jgi:hypothetical protein
MARLTNTTIYGAANVTGNVVTTGYTFDISANNGVNISNANTVSSVIFTNNGSYNGLAGVPSVIFSAPTTGGGTANANVLMRLAGTLSIGNVGVGYANGDYLFANTGQYLQPAQIQITSNTATTYGTGGINGFSIISYGLYFSLPNANVIGGVPYITFANTTGSGAGANVSAASYFTVNNVYFQTTGSGYVEQPTVTFTGGSPSTAATGYVYLNSTIQNIRLLGQTTSFYQGYQSNPAFQIGDGANGNGGASGGYWLATNGASGGSLFSVNTPSGPAFIGTGSGSAGVGFRTNFNYDQFRITHTASAVNYVNATGAATGAYPQISAQGSDGSIYLDISAKGSASVRVLSTLFAGRSSANYWQMFGASSGSSPSLVAVGTDANVAMNLVTTGNAAVQLTGNTTGYIPAANSIYVGNRVGFASSNNISVVYQTWNTTTNSLDVVYG